MDDTSVCAGRTTRVSNRPHPLCRSCSRWQYGAPDGITPRWMDQDGTASCGDRVFVALHGNKVGDAATAPQVGGLG